MNPHVFGASLAALAEVFTHVNARSAASNLRRVASIFAASREKTAAATLKKIDNLTVSAHGDGEVAELTKLLQILKSFVDCSSGKAFANLFDLLIEVLGKYVSVTVDAFADAAITKLTAPKSSGKAPPREEIVGRYVRWLEDCLGDESFIVPFKQLEQDKTLTNAELVEIGKRFTGKKLSGPKTREAIWARHNAVLAFRSKSESRAGRSAA